MANYTDMDIAYLAGIIDGEGAFLAYIYTIYFQLILKITNTDLRLLEHLQYKFGGRINGKNAEDTKKKWKPCYILRWSGVEAIKITKEIFPYLIVKKEHAQLFLDYPMKWSNGAKTKYRYQKIPDIDIMARESICLKIKKLNEKGVPLSN
jgi:hypothetical protein